MPPTAINRAIVRLLRRAEEEDPTTLAETFVDVNALFDRLSTRDSQAVLGRRGTGKTHTLKYLTAMLRRDGETVVYLDLRLLGSSGGIYTDPTVSFEEAGTRLLVDVLQSTYEDLLNQAFDDADRMEAKGGDVLLDRLEKLGDALGEIEIVGETEKRESESAGASGSSELGIEAPRLSAFARVHESQRLAAEREVVMRGVARHRVHFGSVASALQGVIPHLPGKRLWLIMDEWSHISMELQPLLADLIRHCLLPIPGVTVKFGAIENRSTFKVDRSDRSYLGIELGADVMADIDLDEFMVTSAAGSSATAFFAQLFQRHIEAAAQEEDSLEFSSPQDFVAKAFASEGAFSELVRAAEGVPRDGINILSKAALHAADGRITLRNVRDAARGWYISDKQATLRTRPAEHNLLHWIIDQVIGRREVRGFLLEQGSESHLVNWLYDARLIHLVRRGIGAKDRVGVRFDAYAVDYGCYVDLQATRGGGPKGLLHVGDDDNGDVPDDDPDRIRGAILDLDEFGKSDAAAGARRERPTVTLYGHGREGAVHADSVLAFEAEDPPAKWCLLVEDRQRVVAVPLAKRPLRVGSSSKDQVRIQADSVVPRHMSIEMDGDEPVLIAQGAPVYVNDSRVSSARRLAHRDYVSIGDAYLLVMDMSETKPA